MGYTGFILGFGAYGSGPKVEDLGFRVEDLGFRVKELRARFRI